MNKLRELHSEIIVENVRRFARVESCKCNGSGKGKCWKCLFEFYLEQYDRHTPQIEVKKEE